MHPLLSSELECDDAIQSDEEFSLEMQSRVRAIYEEERKETLSYNTAVDDSQNGRLVPVHSTASRLQLLS